MNLTEAMSVRQGDKLYRNDSNNELMATGILEVDYQDGKLKQMRLHCVHHGTTYTYNPELLTKEAPKDKVFTEWLSDYLTRYSITITHTLRMMLKEAYELGIKQGKQ